MSEGVELPVEGSNSVRSWSLLHTESGIVLNVWSSVWQKLLCFTVCAASLVPGVLLWDLVGSHSTSTPHWMAALLYTVIVFVLVVVSTDFCGREVARLDETGLTVRHFSIFAWLSEFLETRNGAEVIARAGTFTMRGLAVVTRVHRVDFGRGLPADASAEIAVRIQAAIHDPPEAEHPPDGVVRRVSRHHGRHTPAGADDLMAEEQQSPLVSDGVLRWGARPLPWAMVFWAGWLTALAVGALEKPDERLVPVAVGALIFGVLVCRRGVLDRLLARRRRSLLVEHAAEPWRAVPYWRDGVVGLAIWRRTGVPAAAIAFGVVVIVAAFPGLNGPGTGNIVAVSIAGLWCAGWAYRLQNLYFQGVTEVRVREMPVPARGEIVLDFAVGARGAHFDSIQFRLLRLVEVPRLGDAPFLGHSHSAEYVLPDDQPPPAPGEQVEVPFVLPPNASGTDLARGRPAYWMLEVTGDTSAGFYSERFPVPIYDVDAQTAASDTNRGGGGPEG